MGTSEIAHIVSLNAPVLCVDTCALLDLIRDPTRETINARDRQAAIDLLVSAETSKDLVVLLADQVKLELNEHKAEVEEETRRALEKLKTRLEQIDAVASVYGGVGVTDLTHLDDHVNRGCAILDRWTNISVSAAQADYHVSKAFNRMNDARTPARKGKDSMKDCVVIETYLDIVTSLRGAGFAQPIVFVSSNVKDFAQESGAALKSDLASEFHSLSMEYAPNMSAAKHHLGL